MGLDLLILIVIIALVIWYFSNRKKMMLNEDIRAYLMFIASKMDNENFRQYSQLWEQFKRSKEGKMRDPRRDL